MLNKHCECCSTFLDTIRQILQKHSSIAGLHKPGKNTGTVLWHCNIGEKQNEISALKPLLTASLLKGRIMTLDAMHTQRELCAQVQQGAGKYVLIAKDNQPTLAEDIAALFEDTNPDRRRWMQAESWGKGHGRLEHRQLTCSPDRNRLVCQAMARH